MKHSIRTLLVLMLTLCTLTVTAFADMGPKSQLMVKVEHPPQEAYVLDLLEEGNSDVPPISALPEDDFLRELEFIGLTDPTLYESLLAAVPDGWRACLCQPYGAPIWGSLIGEPDGDTMLHAFNYFGVPDVYRILIVTESGEIWISDTLTRDALQSSATVDWAAKTASAPPVWVGYALQFLATFLPTLLLEGLILLLFRYRQKRSWAVFGVTNLVTQGALAATLSINVIRHGAGFGFLLLFAAAEFAVLVVEAVAYVVLLKERSRKTAVFYALAANAVSAGVGRLISEPVWRFVVSIS